MFLRYTTRKKNGKEHRYYSLVENRRVAGGGVMQRHVLYLGEINDSQQEAWRKTIEIFEEGQTLPRTVALFPEERIGAVADADIVRIRLSQLSLHRPRQWGGCWLACQLWEQLGLDQFWAQRLPPSRKGTRWDWVLQVMVAYRLLDPGSEWRLYRHWFEHSAMADLLGADLELAEIHKLYECHERLLEHKRELFTHLTGRWKDSFNARFEVLLYDLTSTYFESNPPFGEEDKRRHGYSRDKRSDCVQVVIALIVTPDTGRLPQEDRGAIRQGRAHLGDGPGHSDREGVGANARGRSAGAIPGGHAARAPESIRAKADTIALANRAGRSVGQTLSRRFRVVRVGRKQRPGEQGASHAAPSIERTLEAAQKVAADETQTRRVAQEVGRGLARFPGRGAFGGHDRAAP
jgi:hypothetical protein